MLLKESSIPNELKIKMRTEANYDWLPEDTEDMYNILFTAISKFLGLMKSKEKGAAALLVNDYKANLIMAAIVRYIPNEDNENMPGNWNLSYTVNPDDLDEIPNKFYSEDVAFHRSMSTAASTIYNYGFISTVFIEDVTKWCLTALKDCLDVNAKPGEEVSIELDDMFVARVAIEDDVKIISIEPGTKAKQLIKDDSAIQA